MRSFFILRRGCASGNCKVYTLEDFEEALKKTGGANGGERTRSVGGKNMVPSFDVPISSC